MLDWSLLMFPELLGRRGVGRGKPDTAAQSRAIPAGAQETTIGRVGTKDEAAGM